VVDDGILVVFNFVGWIYIFVVLRDVCVVFNALLVEVYISNVYVCEEFWCYFYIFFVVIVVIVGFGV